MQHRLASPLQRLHRKIIIPARRTNRGGANTVRLDDGWRGQQQRADVLPVHNPAIANDAMSNSHR
jgi:hypothetical protein